MKINNISNIDKFFEVVNSCEGNIYLVSKEGDRLNLKSSLSQYFALAKVFSNDEIIPQLELVAYEPEDTKKLLDFMLSPDK